MIEAVIFDMDGVISDTQKIHSEVESEIFSRYDVKITPEEISDKYAGVRTREVFTKILSSKGVDFDVEELMQEKTSKAIAKFKISVDPVDGIYDLLDLLDKLNIKKAVASASFSELINIILNQLNVVDRFDALVGADMVSNGKPDPEIFLLAAKKINVNPEKCLVIEDGLSGMIGASKANMKCIGLVRKVDFDKYPTKNQILSLSDIDEEYLLRL
ncbi:MAG: HAD family phosphatase [Candidatus Pacebacteria bacterium]|nr:HAD family phosphatase [Candidatus Paceibacterota bacterium]MDD3808252.1 HAD family phosphatase [Candidatus Paceibacterota bacterium]